jgi:PhnB protein
MQFAPYLNFAGNCREAFTRYNEIFGGRLIVMTFGETPMAAQMPAEWSDKVAHARIEAGDCAVMGSDCPPDRFAQPRGISVHVAPPSVAEGERIFAALAEGGSVTMPAQKTFWSAYFGMVVDRFGISWMVNCNQAG